MRATVGTGLAVYTGEKGKTLATAGIWLFSATDQVIMTATIVTAASALKDILILNYDTKLSLV